MVTDNVDATNDSVLSDYYTRSDVVEDSADITPVPVFSSTVVDIEMQDVSVSNTSIDLLVPVFSYTTVDVDMHNNSASNTSIEVESTAVTDTEAVMFTSQNESAPDPSMLEPLDPLHHTSMPSNFNESSLLDSDPEDPDQSTDSNSPLPWQIVEGGTNRGKKRLIDSAGYSYVVSKNRPTATDWVCSIRNKTVKCAARVTQRGDSFTAGINTHCHPAVAGTAVATKIKVASQRQAINQPFVSAGKIVDDVMVEHLPEKAPCDALPKMTSIQRAVNRRREKTRPRHPSTLDFDIQEESVPDDFLRADINVGARRHLFFATTLMLTLLTSAKNWFMDATFRLVRAPFTQLFTIHAFVRQGDALKQLPLAYVLMSGKKTSDYKSVLLTILQELPRTPKVKTITIDFEAAMWSAIGTTMPDVEMRGCSFHWTQAVWRKVQGLGLATTYNSKRSTYKFIKRVMALPFLPAVNVTQMFGALSSSVTNQGPLRELLNYIDHTWLNSGVWPIQSWSVYGRSIRTNNDCEGWHNRLNNQSRGQQQLNMYLLINILHHESKTVSHQVTFISDGKLRRYQRNKYAKMQGIIFRAWDDFENGSISVSELLKKCSRLNGPIVRD